jgi:transcriptional regulator with XRE-family HTH domain
MPSKKTTAKPAKAKPAKKVKPMKKAKRQTKAKRLSKQVKAIKAVRKVKASKVTKPSGFDLSSALKAKIKASGLSKSAAAKMIGVTALSVQSTLAGKSKPNARTIKKYLAFVGAPVKELAGEKESKPKARRGRPPGSGKKRGRPPGKGKGRRGRPPGSKSKKLVKKGRGGRPPGRPPGRPKVITIKAGRFPKGEMTAIEKARKAVEEILSDRLAIMVHNMSAAERAKLEKILR